MTAKVKTGKLYALVCCTCVRCTYTHTHTVSAHCAFCEYKFCNEHKIRNGSYFTLGASRCLARLHVKTN